MASSSSNAGKILKRANPSTIHDKFLVGYQGWFTCAGDGEPVGPGHHGWLHWFNQPIPDGGRPNTDCWPDVSSYSPSELYMAPGLKTKTGDPLFLFSSRNAKTVQRHFHWMAEHGVDGAFLQRFAGQCDLELGNEGVMRIRDEVGDRVREAAEREGRVFAIMYDVSGVKPDRIQRILERDWIHLVRNKGVLDSPNYLKERGKPVVALWGFGFDNAGHTPALVRAITQFFRNTTPGGVYIMGGAPAHWRTAESDADRNPEFLDVWLNEFDAISPWTVGRYRTEQDADNFAETKTKGDVELIKRRNEEGTTRRIDYIPVVLPGGSGYNLSEGKWGFNDIKRNGGRFLWKQIHNARRLGVRTIYGAMWDEYDEGTAFMPIVDHKRLLPASDKFPFLALDEDGYDIPSDWYMRICGFAAEGLRNERRIHETFPSKELQDYWSSRPRYEELDPKSKDFVSGSNMSGNSGGASSSSAAVGEESGDGQTYQEWLSAQKEEKEDAPPPPYSLEADEEANSTPPQASAGVTPVALVAAAVPPPVAALVETPPVMHSHPAASSIAQNPAAALHPVNASAYPGYGEHPQSYPGVISPTGTSSPHPYQDHAAAQPSINANTHPQYGGPSTQGYPGAVASPVAPGNFHQQQDPVTALTNDFGHQSISGGPSAPLGGRMSTPPMSTRPAISDQAPYGTNAAFYPGQPPRPISQQGSRPSQALRPTSQYGSQSQGGYHPAAVSTAVSAATPSPIQETSTPGGWPQTSQSQQWPPAEWNVSAAAAPPLQHPSYSGPAHSAHGPAAAYGGASLSRPQTFTASSYGTGGAPLRPHASVTGSSVGPRPQSRPSTATSQVSPSGQYTPPNAEQFGSSIYPAVNTHNLPNYATKPYSQSTPSTYTPTTTNKPPFQGHGAPNFPNTSYAPPVSTYAGQTGSAYSGQAASPYPSQGSNFPWSGGPPHLSPPHSPPGGATSFPGQSTYPGQGPSRPYNPAQGSHYAGSGPSFPSNPMSSHPQSSVPTSHQLSNSSPSTGPPHFPQGPPGGDGAYFSNMPSNPSSHHSSPTFPGQHGTSPYHGPSYPQSSMPSAGAWMPGGGPSPPAMPPRPPAGSSAKPPGPSFPMASTTGQQALGFALSAVDKVAGRKTRDQLESGVGSLAQTGSKLFNKFTK
ncbi:hypothetical protein B0H34DRAFT_61646 [Crassisporium funariophilum]|nr:hypothetical protein B0H34DRAFT_61646 [Crassisporium funariophilum]